MAGQGTEEIVRGIYAAFNDKDVTAISELYEPDAQMTSHAFNQTMPARDYMQNWLTAFPDGQIEVINMVATGEWCVAEFIGRGTQTGPLQTPEGVLEPSGQRVEINMCELMRVRNGKVTEARSYFDAATFLTQLGEFAVEETTLGSEAWETEEQPVLH